jgi:uncharacterized NAD(P)/FAD-binding protein YdhS
MKTRQGVGECMELTFAIIGCGLTGTSAFCQFIQNLRERAGRRHLGYAGIRIAVVEKQRLFGPGFPYSDEFVMPCHMTNTCAEEMGIEPDDPRGFKEWAESESGRPASGYTVFPRANEFKAESCTYYPRAVMGEYLRARFMESVETAQGLGCGVSLYPRCEVLEAAEKGKKLTLRIKELEGGEIFFLEADHVLLATGHWFNPSNDTRYFSSPWPARALLEGIPRGASVAVLGSSLSAVDAVLTLTSEGEFFRAPSGELAYRCPSPPRTVALCSRKGILPKVRGKMGHYKNRFLTQGNVQRLLKNCVEKPALEGLLRLLRLDLEAVYGHPIPWSEVMSPSLPPIENLERDLKKAEEGDGPQGELLWQTVLHQSFFMARDVYLLLQADEKMRFEKQHSTLFFSYAAPMPPVVAEKLLALLKSGTVQVSKLGEAYSLLKDAAGMGYEILFREQQGENRRDCYDYLVDARGQERSFAKNPSELAGNLLRSGLVHVERLSLGPRNAPPRGRQIEKGETVYNSGSLRIDPETHQVLRMKADRGMTPSRCLYAAGIMTRGQILDASTARGCALSASRVASQWANLIDWLPAKSTGWAEPC